MFKRKLQALKHHNPENFNIKDENQFKVTVVWLEDQHIRHYKVEDRAHLKNINSTNWPEHFKQYLVDLECPILSTDKVSVFDWLLGWAVHLEYVENLKLYQDKTLENISKTYPSVPRIISENPLDSLEFESAEFKTGIDNLAKLLNITKHPDHLVTLKAICQLVKERFCAEIQQNPNERIVSGKPYPLQEYDLGFDTGDYVLNNASKILRLLFIKDLRDLQTKINELIVAVQAITANPKTDSSLGKVGK